MSGPAGSLRLPTVALLLAALAPATACGASTAPPPQPPAAQTTAPEPSASPVSAAATVTGNCVMGYENNTPDAYGGVSNSYSGFQAGDPEGVTIAGNTYAPALAYQLTVTNNSAATAEVNGFAVVFYDSAGTELSSDTRQGFDQFITTGQSLTWTELADRAMDGAGDGGNDPNIPVAAHTCQLVQWNHP